MTVLISETCCKCNIEFGVPADFQCRRRDDHAYFYCPSGHAQHYTGETEADRLRRELARERANSAHLQLRVNAERSAAKGSAIKAGLAKAALRRAMQRVGRGVCPCCNRTFAQLARHMKAKHPQEAQ